MDQKICISAPNRAFEGGSLRLCFRRRSKRELIVRTCATVSESNTMTPLRYAATCFKLFITSLITLTNHPGEALLP